MLPNGRANGTSTLKKAIRGESRRYVTLRMTRDQDLQPQRITLRTSNISKTVVMTATAEVTRKKSRSACLPHVFEEAL